MPFGPLQIENCIVNTTQLLHDAIKIQPTNYETLTLSLLGFLNIVTNLEPSDLSHIVLLMLDKLANLSFWQRSTAQLPLPVERPA